MIWSHIIWKVSNETDFFFFVSLLSFVCLTLLESRLEYLLIKRYPIIHVFISYKFLFIFENVMKMWRKWKKQSKIRKWVIQCHFHFAVHTQLGSQSTELTSNCAKCQCARTFNYIIISYTIFTNIYELLIKILIFFFFFFSVIVFSFIYSFHSFFIITFLPFWLTN